MYNNSVYALLNNNGSCYLQILASIPSFNKSLKISVSFNSMDLSFNVFQLSSKYVYNFSPCPTGYKNVLNNRGVLNCELNVCSDLNCKLCVFDRNVCNVCNPNY